jgi:hypothetical protein
VADPVTEEAERSMLTGFLDWYRGVAEHKLADLTLEQTTSVAMPSGLTMLGTIKHLAWCERRWFEQLYLGGARDELDAHESFALDAGDTVASVVDDYRDACTSSRRIVAAAPSLDQEAQRPHAFFGTPSLRWILLHMIEETARHAGHLDIVRELTDGRTGD